jgi:DNA-binding NtrC family response regulator
MIIFLDDEPHFCQAYIDVIEDAGFVVDVVTTTDELWQALSPATEAVVIDVMLTEGIDAGVVAFRRMREVYPHLPAILLTNRADLDLGGVDDRAVVVSKRETVPEGLLDLLNKIMLAAEGDRGNR